MLTIKEIREKIGVTQQELAIISNIPRDRIAKWEQGKGNPKTLDYLTLNDLVKKWEESPVKFKDFVNYKLKEAGIDNNLIEKDTSIFELQNDKEVEKTIPYYPEVNASAGLNFLTNNGHNYSVPITIPNVDAEAFINVFGDSMYPKFCSGEIIGIKTIEKDFVMFGQAYVIQMTDGEAYIKYIRRGKDDKHWVLASENEMYEPKEFALSKIDKVFIIKAVITKTTLL